MLKQFIKEAESLRQFFHREKPFGMKELSKQLIEEAALHNDKLKALMAVLAYALFKLSTKTHVAKSQKWQNARMKILEHLEKAVLELREKKFKSFEQELESAIEDISRADSEISNYAVSVFEKAKTKMASSAYALGLSLGQAAMLTGADKKDLLNYIGFTKMHDEAGVMLGIEERLKKLEEVISG